MSQVENKRVSKTHLRINKTEYGGDAVEERQCSICDEWWPNEKYYFAAKNGTELTTYCRDCYRIKYKPNLTGCRDFTHDDANPKVKELNVLWAQHGFVRTHYRNQI